jgi:hypothetical protein
MSEDRADEIAHRLRLFRRTVLIAAMGDREKVSKDPVR